MTKDEAYTLKRILSDNGWDSTMDALAEACGEQARRITNVVFGNIEDLERCRWWNRCNVIRAAKTMVLAGYYCPPVSP